MSKVALVGEPKQSSSAVAYWTHALPFVQNSRGILIHRPRSVSIYNLHKNSHMAVGMLCGMHVTCPVTERSHVKFLAIPPDDCLMCERCEQIAFTLGLPTASELAGRHVHHGKVKGVKTCCQQGEPK